MSKVEGTFQSVTKGVSQQAPADRLEGQHGEVVNMIMDPVRGAVRRNGMILENRLQTSISASDEDLSQAVTDSFSFREFSYRDGGKDYDILYRSREKIGDSDAHLPALVIQNKTEGEIAWVPVVTNPGDTAVASFENGGFSAMASIGSYVLMAANSLQPSYTVEAAMEGAHRGKAAVWIRGGSYSRTYTIKVRRRSDGAVFNVSYTTMNATSSAVYNPTGNLPNGEPFPLAAVGTPHEQWFTNSIRAHYDNQVNDHTRNAAISIVPSNIAVELRVKLEEAGMMGWQLRGSHMLHDDVDWIEVDDGGNGEFIRAVASIVDSPDDMTNIHYVGKVVEVQPDDSEADSYYLQAYAETESNPDPIQSVYWLEAPGEIQKPDFILGLGRIVDGTFYWASSPALLRALILSQTGLDLDVPTYVNSTAGDTETVSEPHFFVAPITMLTTFQDRLLIGSGSVVNMSEQGDYFNFYRTTMLTIPDTDPAEFTAAGTESDTLRTSVLYDRNLMIQGDKFHYTISGRQDLSASAPKMAVQFALQGAGYAKPVGVGKYVYVLKEDTQLAASRLMQIQAGIYQDSPDLNDVSKQLRDYVNGSPATMVALTSPSAVFVRTEHFLKSQGAFPRARPWGVYLFQYLDGDDGSRVQEAWSAWEWSGVLGTPIGMTDAGTGDSIYLYTVGYGADENGSRAMSIFCMKASARADPSGLPYLDALQPAATAEATGLWTPAATEAAREVVYTAASAAHSYNPVPATTDAARFTGLEHPHYTVGDAPPETVDAHRWDGTLGWATDYATEFPEAPSDNVWTGLAFPAFIDPTNPFVRDRDGKAKTYGTLNLGQFALTLTRTAGVRSSFVDHDGTVVQQGFRDTYSRIKYNEMVWIGREAKDVQVRIEAVDWLPLTINAIAWKGNWFASQG